jgi:hypothetical protein
MVGAGATVFIEVGPGKVLGGLLRRLIPAQKRCMWKMKPVWNDLLCVCIRDAKGLHIHRFSSSKRAHVAT